MKMKKKGFYIALFCILLITAACVTPEKEQQRVLAPLALNQKTNIIAFDRLGRD